MTKLTGYQLFVILQPNMTVSGRQNDCCLLHNVYEIHHVSYNSVLQVRNDDLPSDGCIYCRSANVDDRIRLPNLANCKNSQFKTTPTFSILHTIINLVEPRISQIKTSPSCPDYEIRQFNTSQSFANLQ